MASNQRPIQLLIRSKGAVELYTLPDTSSSSSSPAPKKGGTTLYTGKSTFHLLNPNGSCAYIHDSTVGLIKCDVDGSNNSSSNNAPFLQNSKSIQLAKCSPRGSYLLTWERPNSGSADNGNLKVWNAADGSFIQGFSCKKATLSTVQWTHDESLVYHLVTNEIHVHSSKDFGRVGKVRCMGVASFSLPEVKGYGANTTKEEDGNDNKYLLTVFVPGVKGKPARVDLLRYPDRMGRDGGGRVGSALITGSGSGCGTIVGTTIGEIGEQVPTQTVVLTAVPHPFWRSYITTPPLCATH